VAEATTALVEGNEVCGKHINGLQAGGNANPLVKNNKIRNSSGSGIVLHDWSKGTYANNHVECSKLAGVGIRQKNMFSKVWALAYSLMSSDDFFF
jgi:parallel beta-helix repeat protein